MARAASSAPGRCAAPPGSWRHLPSLFGLAPCGVYPAPAFTGRAVRSYRTISPLPRRWSLPQRQANPASRANSGIAFPGRPSNRVRRNGGGVAEAVSFLWHWPSASLEARIPDVIRHTALRSSDFPPPDAQRLRAKSPAATARSSCQSLVYRETRSRIGYARNAPIL